ncbi:hypothetical protein LguiB_017873 [Lonicera macranthoides]
MAIVRAQEASSSAFRYNYQVFLSFRGEDTRKAFTDHLYTALLQAGLRTFRDDDDIEGGKRLELELRKAIHGSRISIIVFSKNYASSKWCLDEAMMILEWSRTSGHEVLPVFYHVDPSDGTETIEGLILDMHMLKDDDRSCFIDKNTKKSRYKEFVDEPLLSNKANSLKRRYLNFLSWQSMDISLRSPNKFLADLKNVESLKEFQIDRVAKNLLILNAVRGFKLWDAFSLPWLSKSTKSVESFWASLPWSLVNLSLANCNLSNDSFPTNLCNLVSLRELNLSQNPFLRVPDCINGIRGLKYLHLEHCQRLKYVCVTNVEFLNLGGSKHVERIIYLERRPFIRSTGFLNLLKFEGKFKLKHLVEVEREMLNNLGLFNLELIGNLVVRLAFPFVDWCDISQSLKYQTKDLPIQGFYEFGIFSTFLPKAKAPNWCNELNTGSSISFIVPSYPNLWIKGLNVCVVYALSNRKETWFPPPIFTKISNMTKDLNWIYKPWLRGIPAEDGEELAWLSHWKFGNQLESGDEVIISMVTGDSLEVKECSFNIVWVDQEEKETIFNTGHNLSSHQVKTGVYFLSRGALNTDDHSHRTAPRWFGELFGDSTEFDGISSTLYPFLFRVGR